MFSIHTNIPISTSLADITNQLQNTPPPRPPTLLRFLAGGYYQSIEVNTWGETIVLTQAELK